MWHIPLLFLHYIHKIMRRFQEIFYFSAFFWNWRQNVMKATMGAIISYPSTAIHFWIISLQKNLKVYTTFTSTLHRRITELILVTKPKNENLKCISLTLITLKVHIHTTYVDVHYNQYRHCTLNKNNFYLEFLSKSICSTDFVGVKLIIAVKYANLNYNFDDIFD